MGGVIIKDNTIFYALISSIIIYSLFYLVKNNCKINIDNYNLYKYTFVMYIIFSIMTIIFKGANYVPTLYF